MKFGLYKAQEGSLKVVAYMLGGLFILINNYHLVAGW